MVNLQQIIPPQISEETMKAIADFFMEYEIPKIIEKMKKEGEKKD